MLRGINTIRIYITFVGFFSNKNAKERTILTNVHTIKAISLYWKNQRNVPFFYTELTGVYLADLYNIFKKYSFFSKVTGIFCWSLHHISNDSLYKIYKKNLPFLCSNWYIWPIFTSFKLILLEMFPSYTLTSIFGRFFTPFDNT